MRNRKCPKKTVLLMLADFCIVNLVYPLMVLLHWNFHFDYNQMLRILLRVPFVTLCYLGFYMLARLYKTVWKYAGLYELFRYSLATLGGTIGVFTCDYIGMKTCQALDTFLWFNVLPWSAYVDSTLVIIALCLTVRLSYRSLKLLSVETKKLRSSSDKKILILGAGVAGSTLIHELRQTAYRFGVPVALLDDDPTKVGRSISDTPIVGTLSSMEEAVKQYNIDEIIFCIPTLEGQKKRDIMEAAVNTGCSVKIAPSLENMQARTTSSYKEVRKIDILDLLSRPEIKLNTDVCRYVTDQTILVTGGGGSIGSELCRQIARYHPKKIVIFDIYENNAYTLKNSLDRQYFGTPEVYIRIGSVRDLERLNEVFTEFHPAAVFHAAAHKHVPLMEDSPYEAIKNNILGTYNVADCANNLGAERFVLLSTDKAVNPTNVMGATKRTAELIVQYFSRITKGTTFAAVRFGNVLGSNGSVIPLFKEQLENGGPLTVTHPDITRYFMTIPEAAQLVVQAGGLAQGGEIFVLDMGEPVKIVSLAEKLIRLSGYEPYIDIDIQFTGLRPGEKLYEELVLQSEKEDLRKTQNDKIFVTSPLPIDNKLLLNHIQAIMDLKPEASRSFLKELVATYAPQE